MHRKNFSFSSRNERWWRLVSPARPLLRLRYQFSIQRQAFTVSRGVVRGLFSWRAGSLMNLQRRFGWVFVGLLYGAAPAQAAEWFVAAGSMGNGSGAAPFGRVQDALNVAQAGDVITVRPGTYVEAIRTIRAGTATAPIRLRAEGARGSAIVTLKSDTVLRLRHAYHIIEGLVIDGQYGADDTVLIGSGGSNSVLRNVEVRHSSRDLIELGPASNILIENSSIHHALNASGGRTDAHGIAAGAVRNLTIRNTDIHTFSGDGLQVDPGRSAPGWNNVTIEGSRIWLEPLPVATNGFAAGAVPGENAVDTKTNISYPRSTLTIRDTTAWGYRNGLISNMAAFNLKENIAAVIDGVTVYDSTIAFRARGPGSNGGAQVTIKNAVVYNTGAAFRFEDDIDVLNVWNCTVGNNVTTPFDAASSGRAGLNIRNLLTIAPLPSFAADPSNRRVGPEAFVNAAAHNYALAPNSAAIDQGIALPQVTTDRAGTTRPQGAAYDIGAYEARPAAASGDDIVIYASHAVSVQGEWQFVNDDTAADGVRLWHPNRRAVYKKSATPTHYFEVTAYVEAGKSYRLWLRGNAENNDVANDSVWVQFSDSVNATGAPVFRLGTTSATEVRLNDCSGCGVSGWGWQDNGSGLNVLGPLVRFAATGLQTIRISTFEDGFSIDQIVLSSSAYLTAAPGATKNDTTILPLQ
jgi:hypothetical protein